MNSDMFDEMRNLVARFEEAVATFGLHVDRLSDTGKEITDASGTMDSAATRIKTAVDRFPTYVQLIK